MPTQPCLGTALQTEYDVMRWMRWMRRDAMRCAILRYAGMTILVGIQMSRSQAVDCRVIDGASLT